MTAPCCTRVQLLLDDDAETWTDVTEWTYARDGVQIDRGRRDETGRTDPSQCKLVVRNDQGRFSPRNPLGPYYGQMTRNTQLRAGVHAGTTFLRTVRTGYASTPDHPTLDITGDLDVRIGYRLLPAVREGAFWELAGKWSSGQGSWLLRLFASTNTNTLHGTFGWSTDGTNGTFLAATTLEAGVGSLPYTPTGRIALRVTLDVNNGAGGHTARYFTAPSIDGPWTQLGDDIVGSGTTSVFSGAADLEVGGLPAVLGSSLEGEVYRFELRDGIDGPVVADADFTSLDDGATGFTDDAGRTWTVAGDGEVSNLRWRFHGEVPAWPQTWDDSEQALRVPLQAAGPTRRLGQGQPPVESTYHRGTLTSEALVAYWTMEDGAGSTRLASALDGGRPMEVVGFPDLSSFEGFDSSKPLPLLKDAEFSGRVPAYNDTGLTQVRFLLSPPENGSVDGEAIIQWFTSGTASRWDIRYQTEFGGSFSLRVYDDEGTQLFTTGNLALLSGGWDGRMLQVTVSIAQVGSDVHFRVRGLEPDATQGTVWPGLDDPPFEVAGRTIGRVKRVVVNAAGGHTDLAIGHVHVQAANTGSFENVDELRAYSGEPAGRRFQRLCVENDIPFTHIGDLDDTTLMGPQRPLTLLDLLWECVDTDLGVLYEPRDMLGLGYRTRESFYNQPVQAAFDCCATPPELAGPLGPVEDDRTTRNDITVNRTNGSSARAVKTSGALSVQPPPDGVGRYDDTDPVNVRFDLHLPDQATFRLHLGTVDEARFPALEFELMNPAIEDRLDDLLALDVGGRLTVSDPPVTVPPEPVDVVVVGYEEEFSDLADARYRIVFTAAPASPWDVAVETADDASGDDEPDGPYARFGPLDTTLAEDLTTTETGASIDPGTDVWTTDSDHFPFDIVIGGERMTATGNTGTTLTVTRSVNGIVKSHASGAPVELANPAVRPL